MPGSEVRPAAVAGGRVLAAARQPRAAEALDPVHRPGLIAGAW